LVDWQYVIGWIDDQQIGLATTGSQPWTVTMLKKA
jgi:hypothetical protein